MLLFAIQSLQNVKYCIRQITVSQSKISDISLYDGDAVALLIGHQTCDLQVAGSSLGWASLHSGLGQATYVCVPLLPTGVIWYRPRGDFYDWQSNREPDGK